MEESKDTPSQVNRFQADRMRNIDIIECNKKRKLQSDQLDLLRPKHKCWVGNISSEHASIFDENPVLKSMHNHMVKNITDAAVIDERSEPESAKDSNSFIEDTDTAMSVDEEAKVEADCANTYLYGRPSTSFVNYDNYNVNCNHYSLDVSTVKRVSYSEDDVFIDSEYNPSYNGADIQAMENPEEHLLGLGSFSGHVYSEHVEESSQHSADKELEDFRFSIGVNPNMYVLSSGRWNIDQDAQSSTRPPTIDQEFEQYFSMLML